MPARKDPLERLAQRETEFVEQRSRTGVMRLAIRFYAGLAVAWALVLAAHWFLFPSPRWLVLLHTLGFVLTMGYWAAAALMLRVMQRRMPERFDS